MSVLDTSAVLALIRREPGHAIAASHLRGGAISTTNVQEVVSKLLQRSLQLPLVEAGLRMLALEWVSFDDQQCLAAAELHASYRGLDLSYADCACLALAVQRGEPVVTADRVWAQLSIGIPVVLIR